LGGTGAFSPETGPRRYTQRVRTCALACLFGVVAACGPSVKNGVDAPGGTGDDATGGGNPEAGDPTTDAQACGQLTAAIRDFMTAHPDMEKALGDDRGLVEDDLGVDNKPVYKPPGATVTVSGKTSFDQWYRDVSGVNMHFEIPLPLTEDPPGTFTFDNELFFPIDNMGWGNEGDPHNYHFTTEVHGTFAYHGGEQFQFTGDDDVFVFVNKKLALDLGGIHGAEMASIDFDAMASQLGISVGHTYQLDVFHAERHTVDSHFRMVTTIDCFIIN
jgi:fibro-slime domain-containing protein